MRRAPLLLLLLLARGPAHKRQKSKQRVHGCAYLIAIFFLERRRLLPRRLLLPVRTKLEGLTQSAPAHQVAGSPGQTERLRLSVVRINLDRRVV